MRFCLTLFIILALVSPLASLTAFDEPRELEEFQGYLDPAPRGMDVRYAWSLPGGRGENVYIIDIEYNWNANHAELVAALSDPLILVKGVDPLPEFNIDHGTAVLGELVAAPDGIGVTGIAHRSRIGLINPVTAGNVQRVDNAIAQAVALLRPGDVILLEQQSVKGPRFDPSTGGGILPIEFEPEVFAAIKNATSRGIIVVEPAGNGFENLDDPVYAGVFDRSKRDSGAIIVGAGLPEGGVYGPGPDLSRTKESNYGSRVDVQGWGRFVTTCGYGPLRREQGVNHIYTIDFGATSAAAAMVAGAAALVQSILKERGQPPLSPAQLRRLLTVTGTPQVGSQNIGPRPNLRAVIEALDAGAHNLDPIITGVSFKRSKGRLTVDGENFLPGDSVIEINGAAVSKIKYPSDHIQANGTTTRIMSKKSVSAMLPSGVAVLITVFSPSTGKRSDPVQFINQ